MSDTPRSPGLFYDAKRDALRVHLAPWSDDLEVDMVSHGVKEVVSPGNELRLVAMADRERPVLRVVAIVRASAHLPPAVLKPDRRANLDVHQEPTVLMIPFFPEAVGVTKRVHMLDVGPLGRLGVALASSGRVVGLVVPDHRQRLVAPLGEVPEVSAR